MQRCSCSTLMIASESVAHLHTVDVKVMTIDSTPRIAATKPVAKTEENTKLLPQVTNKHVTFCFITATEIENAAAGQTHL